MLINFPGTIRVRDLVSELAPFFADLREWGVETLTSVALWLQTSSAEGERKLIQLPGSIVVSDLPGRIFAVTNMLELNGIDVVEELEVSLQAWRGPERGQVWGKDGFIGRLYYDAVGASQLEKQARVRRGGITFKYRPEDQDVNLFAVMFGHDD